MKSLIAAPSFEKLGVRGHREVVPGVLGDDRLDLVGGAHGHGALGDDDLEALEGLADRLGDLEHVGEIGRAVFGGRRPHGDEDHLGVADRFDHVGREAEATGLYVRGDQRVEARLVDGDFAPIQTGDLLGVDVRADHVVAEVRKPSTGHQADVTRTHHRKSHGRDSSTGLR